MSTEVNNTGYREINLSLNDKGNIIHSDGWQQTVPNYCLDKVELDSIVYPTNPDRDTR